MGTELTVTMSDLSGWGRTPSSRCVVTEIPVDHLATGEVDLWPEITSRGIVARGRGRSYGDAAQNSGGHVLRLGRRTGSDREPIALDQRSGRVRVDADVDLDELLRSVVPRGWFVPVTPGTREVTVGGAIAAHVHGKNHHRDGSFGAHVRDMTLLLADGSLRRITPAEDGELWWATIGGMGLTGIILDATIDLLAIETSRCRVDTCRTPDLDSLMAEMVDGDDRYRYSVAWIDLLATGASLGRGVLTRGDHATRAELGSVQDPLAFAPRRLAAVPPGLPNLLHPWGVRAFNEVYYRRAPRERTGELQSIGQFFHPLDAVGSWNRLYGRRGFFQYQFVVPPEATETIRQVVEHVAHSGQASFLAVLKRFGAGDAAPLGFPMAGWTLALDLPAGDPSMSNLVRTLDELVLGVGGRHYLAKDAMLMPDQVRAGYPRLSDWLEVRRRFDPSGRFASDLARRLELM